MKTRILLVEDSAILAEDLRLFLPKRFALDWVRGSAEAIVHLSRDGLPALIVLDLCLPPHLSPSKQEEGFALLALLDQRLARGVPIVVMSSHDPAEVAASCLELGAAAYLAKPCIIAEFVALAESLIGTRA